MARNVNRKGIYGNRQLYMKFNNGSELEADILENDFTEAFCELFLEQKRCGKVLAPTKPGYWRHTPLTHDKENWPAEKILLRKHELVKSINEAIRDIDVEFGLKFPRPHAFVSMGQSECNLIHRCFTTAEMTMRHSDGTLDSILWKLKQVGAMQGDWLTKSKKFNRRWWVENFISLDERIIPPISGPVKRFEELIHIINRDIHNFESFTETNNKRKIIDILPDKDSWHLTQRFDVRVDNGCGQILPKDQNVWDHNWRHNCTFDRHDIWLLKDILGKDYHQCWLDEDDPTNIDICNVDLRHSACLCIDYNNGYNQFATSSEFVSWMRAYGLDDDMRRAASPPIGDISNGWDMNDYVDDIRSQQLQATDWDIR